ncbi:S1 family peptidase [[Actinomadura] parvosata]|uniref:S1 family peptidase n=1 Tax=[Actinomadura] parvosata TaxID=1955412 RepID=UPI00406CDBC2
MLALAGCSIAAPPAPVPSGSLKAESDVAAPAPSEEASDGEESVVRLSIIAPSCGKRVEATGFVYAPQRVVTAAHLVAGAVPVSQLVTTNDGEVYEGRVVAFDPDADVAVMYVPKLPAPPLRITAAPKPSLPVLGLLFEGVSMIGYSKGSERLETQWVVLGRRLEAEGPNLYREREVTRTVLEFSAETQAGLDGAPLIGEEGTVIGMVFAASKEDPQRGYALVGEDLLSVTEGAAHATKHVSTQRCETDG